MPWIINGPKATAAVKLSGQVSVSAFRAFVWAIGSALHGLRVGILEAYDTFTTGPWPTAKREMKEAWDQYRKGS